MKRFKLGFRDAFVVQTANGPKAFYDFCTHQGGHLKIEGNQFRCLRHGATFDFESGARTGGEAPEGSRLAEIPLMIEGGVISAVWKIEE